MTDIFKEQFINECYNSNCGVISLRHAILKILEDGLTEAILSGKVNNGGKINVKIDERNKVTVSKVEEQFSIPALG